MRAQKSERTDKIRFQKLFSTARFIIVSSTVSNEMNVVMADILSISSRVNMVPFETEELDARPLEMSVGGPWTSIIEFDLDRNRFKSYQKKIRKSTERENNENSICRKSVKEKSTTSSFGSHINIRTHIHAIKNIHHVLTKNAEKTPTTESEREGEREKKKENEARRIYLDELCTQRLEKIFLYTKNTSVSAQFRKMSHNLHG